MVQKRKKNKKWLIWIGVIALFVLVGVACFLILNEIEKNNTKNDEISDEYTEIVGVEEIGVGMIEDTEEIIEKEKIMQYEGENPNTVETLTGVITYAGVVNDKVMIRVNIDQYLSEGNCELKLLNNDTVVYEETVEITGSTATATCKGFDFSASQFGLGGEYLIILNLSSGDKTGVINGEISI